APSGVSRRDSRESGRPCRTRSRPVQHAARPGSGLHGEFSPLLDPRLSLTPNGRAQTGRTRLATWAGHRAADSVAPLLWTKSTSVARVDGSEQFFACR